MSLKHQFTALPFASFTALLVVVMSLTGCPKESATPTTPADTQGAKVATPATPTTEAAPTAAPTDGMVTVAATGTNFDPAVNKAQIPDGAYICDMGTVHYASLDEGDGKCPRCHMALKKHLAKPAL